MAKLNYAVVIIGESMYSDPEQGAVLIGVFDAMDEEIEEHVREYYEDYDEIRVIEHVVPVSQRTTVR